MADIQFNLRIPEELKEKIKDAASKNGRSINAEAQIRLEDSFTFPVHDHRFIETLMSAHKAGFYHGLTEGYKARLDAINAALLEEETDELLVEKMKYEVLYDEMDRLKELSHQKLDRDLDEDIS